ncbi:MAG: class I SAM-dependent methyltransferase [Gammaproteobacteria bacterium]|nr:class I SAM-dependent methyltransferase [Gammaproteobacteria bacterium]
MALPVYIFPDPGTHPAVRRLATALSLPTLPPGHTHNGLVLEYQLERLQIRSLARREKPWFVDFGSARSSYRRAFGGGVRQTLARAIGIRGCARPHVVDATAGWGRDAFVLASLGCAVDLIERHPLVAELLADGLRRAAESAHLAQIVQRMRLYRCDAKDYLKGLTGNALPDAVFLDPMYPHKGKTAAVKKDLRLLRELLGDPVNDTQLLEVACARARARVVVKRPKSAAPLLGRAPDAQVASANTRYDVYFTALGTLPNEPQ